MKKQANFGYYVELAKNFYLVAVAFKPADKDFKLSNISGFDSATSDYSLVAFNTDEFLDDYEEYGVYLKEIDSLDNFFNATAEIYKAKALRRFKFVNSYYADIRKAELTSKISELKADYTAKKARLTSLESSLAKVLMQINKLENANNELLESENFNDKTFSANALKVATLKRDNRELIDNRNKLYEIVNNLESEIENLETELKELESV